MKIGIKKLVSFISITAAIGLANTSTVQAHGCVGKKHYIATGNLKLMLEDNFATRTGLSVVPIENIQIRLKRPGVSGAGGAGKRTTTDANGRFSAHGCFPRDTNGIGPGGQNIDIQVQARFKSDDVKVRDSRKGQPNWHNVAEYDARGGGTEVLGDIVYNDTSINRPKFNEHASLWWIHLREQQRFADEGTGFRRRLTVIYPHPGVTLPDNKAYANAKIHLGNDDGPEGPGEPKSILHELMHIWHSQNLRDGNVSNCKLGSSHKAPNEKGATRCRGFMEGLSEAVAQKIMDNDYGPSEVGLSPVSTADLATGTGVSYTIASLADLEKTDDGWENVFRYLFNADEWAPNGLTSSSACDARDLTVFELLTALDQANYSLSRPTLEQFFQVLVDEIDGFNDDDATIYKAVADPSTNLETSHTELCGVTTATLSRSPTSFRAVNPLQP